MAINPQNFNLPDQWKSSTSCHKNKEDMVHSAIFFHINRIFESREQLPTLEGIAKELEAPYSVIKAASEHY